MLQRQTNHNELLQHSFMATSFAAATLLLSLHWQGKSVRPAVAVMPAAITASVKPKATISAVASSPNRLVVDLSDRTVKQYKKGSLAETYPIAVGQIGWETPAGTFDVVEMHINPEWEHPITGEVVPAGPENPLGTRWIAFWSDGNNQIGFHGTNQSDLIGQAVSHGCIRMLNEDIEAMYAQVEVGTPVVVQP